MKRENMPSIKIGASKVRDHDKFRREYDRIFGKKKEVRNEGGNKKRN